MHKYDIFNNIKLLPVKCSQLARIVLLSYFIIAHLIAAAQSPKRMQRKFEEARQYMAQRNFELAIEKSHDILGRDSAFVQAHLLLADIYHEKKQTDSEIFHLSKASSLSEMPLIQLRLGNACFSAGKYERAQAAYQSYINKNQLRGEGLAEVERKLKSCHFAIHAMNHPVEFKPEPLSGSINSANDEYWPSLSIDQQQLVFTRLMKEPQRQPQEDFYFSEYQDEQGFGLARPVNEINTPENEGAQSLSADGNILFFTACNRRAGYGSCDLYYSVRRDGRWEVPVNAGGDINSGWWEAQPSFSSDGRFLYFSSNRPGGKGLRDIWRAECKGFDENGKLRWEKPVNLGDNINTPGNETSPFIHAGNLDFYFASDYHAGMGGFDLFVSRLDKDTVFSKARNLGYPINTFSDEQGLHIGADGLTAYFSSARDSITGLDIYSFPVAESIRPHPATYVKAKVSDGVTRKPVQAHIDLIDLTNPVETPRIESTDSQGEILLCLPSGTNYSFSVSKEGYLFYSNTFDLRTIRQVYDPYELQINLEPIRVGAEMNLYNIYFATDSFRILPESEPELNKLTHFLRNNAGLAVEIQGHTDDTGSRENNEQLSEKRARSVVDFLVGEGIQENRLKWAGYGQTRPVADNTTPEGRRQNRRTTIKILGE